MQHRWDPSMGWGQIEFLPGYVKLGSSTFKTPSIYQGLLVYLHFHIPKWINTHILLSNLPQSFWGNNYNYTVVLQSETFWCLFLQGFLMHIWSHESACVSRLGPPRTHRFPSKHDAFPRIWGSLQFPRFEIHPNLWRPWNNVTCTTLNVSYWCWTVINDTCISASNAKEWRSWILYDPQSLSPIFDPGKAYKVHGLASVRATGQSLPDFCQLDMNLMNYVIQHLMFVNCKT